MSIFREGLDGIVAAKTNITHIDTNDGRLIYRGYEVGSLARKNSFEEVAYLLLFGDLPADNELNWFNLKLREAQNLHHYIFDLVDNFPLEVDLMSALRTAISSMSLFQGSYNIHTTSIELIKIIAAVPIIIAACVNKKNGQERIHPDPNLGYVENYLYMLSGKQPTIEQKKILEVYLILTMDHSLNASTFTARIVTSTEADVISSIVAAIGALMGPLHGGAPSKVDSLLEEIQSVDRVRSVITRKVGNGERIMGFGHRVYKGYDPRSKALRDVCMEFQSTNSFLQLSFETEKIIIETLQVLKPGRNLYPNIEYWAAAALKVASLTPDLYTPTFCVGRAFGWSAHILEQRNRNRLIRPLAEYTGRMPSQLPARSLKASRDR